MRPSGASGAAGCADAVLLPPPSPCFATAYAGDRVTHTGEGSERGWPMACTMRATPTVETGPAFPSTGTDGPNDTTPPPHLAMRRTRTSRASWSSP